MANVPGKAGVSMLIVSDSVSDVALVKDLLAASFSEIHVSTDEDRAVEEFERRMPQVLVLAFKKLAKAERYCLGLYRRSTTIHSHRYKTIVLCDKSEVLQVAQLCVDASFDDYVLFWPLNHDAQRLRVSVHQALRDLAAQSNAGPPVAEFAAQARRLAELEGLLAQQMSIGGRHVQDTRIALKQAERGIGAALEGFGRRLSEGAWPDVAEVKDSAGLQREFSELVRTGIEPPMRAVANAIKPIEEWQLSLQQRLSPHLESARAMGSLADQIRPIVMIVDDDDFQRKLIARMLENENYRLILASSGVDALTQASKTVPDLVLMDVQMAEMNGVETTRRLKAAPLFANVTVVMVTGKSEGQIVIDSLKAGASDFLVKPISRERLMAKVAHWISPRRSSGPTAG